MKSRPVSFPRAGRQAFTLIELLTVIAIIAILAALLLQTSGFIQEKAGNNRAQAGIAALGTALGNYKLDMGTYPEGDGGDNSTEKLLDALNPTGGTAKIYFEVPPKMLNNYRSKNSAAQNRADSKRLVDPFGNPYHYEYNEGDDNSDRSGKGQFNLWSQGKNGAQNAGKPDKWIKNW